MKLSKSLSSLYSIPKLASPVKFFRKTAGANKFISAMLFSAFFLANSIIKAQTAPELGEAERFAVLAGDSITSTDSAFVKGDAGATTLIDSTIISDGGTFKDTACIVVSAINDLTIAKQEAVAQPATAVAPQTLKDTTLTSGVYQISQLRIKDTLILSGDSTSVFIFNISDSLIFEVGTIIILDGVKAENIFWNVAGSVCIEDSASVCGTVMVDGTICCHQEATLISGRLLSSQSVTLEQAGTVDSREAQQFTVADIELGSGAYFAVLAGENITVNDPISAVGNVGAMGTISGAITASDTLFPANDCRVQQAISDLGNVINTIINLPASLISEQLGGQTLAPGVYYVNADAILNGTLTLTGDSASVYAFRFLGSDLASHELTVTNNSILDIGDVRPENIYWAGSNITLGENINFSGIVISFKGEIIAQGKNTGKASLMAMQSITLFNINQNNPVYLFSQYRMSQQVLFTVEDINLGAASSFALLADSNITSNDTIAAVGNVGSFSGIVSGNIFTTDTLFQTGDPEVGQAIGALDNAIFVIEHIPEDSSISGNLGGQTLSEGVYDINGNALLSGTLTLTGGASSIYVFRITDTLTVDSGAVLELGNVLPQNVYWVMLRSYASIGKNANFSGIVMTRGNILCKAGINGKLALLTTGGSISLSGKKSFIPIFLFSQTNMFIIIPGTERIDFTTLNNIAVCGDTATYTITISTGNNPDPYIIVSVVLPPELGYIQGSGVTDAYNIWDISDTIFFGTPTFVIFWLDEDTIINLSYDVFTSSCLPNPGDSILSYLLYTPESITDMDTIDIDTSIINVFSPIININQLQMQQSSSIPGNVRDTICRSITISNDGNAPLLSGFTVTENYGPALEFVSITIDSAILSVDITNRLITIIVPADSLPPGGFMPGSKFVFQECFRIVSCTDVDSLKNLGLSAFNYSWSCDTAVCQGGSTTANILVPATNKAGITVSASFINEDVCYGPGNSSEVLATITNSGNGPAFDFRLKLFGISSLFMAIDTIQFELDGIPVVPDSLAFGSDPAFCSSPYISYAEFLMDIPPLTTRTLLFNAITCCPDTLSGCGDKIKYLPFHYSYHDQCAADTDSVSVTNADFFYIIGELEVLALKGPDEMLDWEFDTVPFKAEDTSEFVFNILNFKPWPGDTTDMFMMVFNLNGGLCYLDSSLEITNNNTSWLPQTVVVDIDSGTCAGTVTAFFSFNDKPDTLSVIGADIHIWFIAQCPTQAASIVDLSTFYVPSINCPDTCAIPLSCGKQLITFVQCPGCDRSGIFSVDADFFRKNLGLPDNDNNGIADIGTIPDINRELLMVGDTLTGVVTSSVQYLAYPANPVFRYGYYEILIPDTCAGSMAPVTNLVTGNIYDAANNTTYIFQLKPPELFATDEYRYDFSIDTIHQSGVPLTYDRFSQGDKITIMPEFVVTGNVGPIIQPCAPLRNHVYLGMAYLPQCDPDRCEPDTLLAGIVLSNGDTLPPTGGVIACNDTIPFCDSTVQYWCENAGGSFLLTGYEYVPQIGLAGVTNCVQSISVSNYIRIGPYNDLSIPGNWFSYEYRNWGDNDTVSLTIPTGFILDSVTFTANRSAGGIFVNQSVSRITPDNKTVDSFGDTVITVYSQQYFTTDTAFAYQNDSLIYFADDDYAAWVIAYMHPNCQTPEIINMPVKAYISYEPAFEPDNPALFNSNIPGYVFNYLPPVLDIQSISSPSIDGVANFACWDVSVQNIGGNASNVWLASHSPSGNIQVSDMLVGMDTLTVQNGIYQLESINAGTDKNVKICVQYSCDFTLTADSIVLFLGWDCPASPDSLQGALCPPDTIKLYLNPKQAELQHSVLMPDSVSICDTIIVAHTIQNINAANVYNITVTATLPAGIGYDSLSGFMQYPVTALPVPANPQINQDTLIFNLGNYIPYINDNGIPGSGFVSPPPPDSSKLLLTFNLLSSCSLLPTNSIDITVTGITNCGDSIDELNFTKNLIIRDYPTPTEKTIAVSATNFSGCDSTATIDVVIINKDTTLTGSQDIFVFTMPGCMNYNNNFNGITNPPDSIPDTSMNVITWNLPDSIAKDDTIHFTFEVMLTSLCSLNTFIFNGLTTSYDSTLFCATTGQNCPLVIPAANDTTIATLPSPLSVSLDSTNVSCNGGTNGSATLTTSGGTAPYTFLWSNGDTTEDISGLIAGTYSVIVTDLNGCTVFDTVVITEPDTLFATITTSNVTCNGLCDGSSSVTITGGVTSYSIAWINDPTFTLISTDSAVNNLCAGNIILFIFDNNGCVFQQNFQIQQPQLLTASITDSSDALCFDQSGGSATVTPSGGTPPYNYLWTPLGGTDSTAAALPSGTYSVLVTDTNGCDTVVNVQINEPDEITASIDVVFATCAGSFDGQVTLTVTGGMPPYTLSPQGIQFDSVLTRTGLSGGSSHTFTIFDSNGCLKVFNAFIGPQPLNINFSTTLASSCISSDGSATAIVTGGTPPYTYLWSDGQTTSTAAGLGFGIFNFTVTDNNGCTKSGSVNIGSIFSVDVTGTPSCGGGPNGTATAIPQNSSALPFTYSWSNGQTDSIATGLVPGIYSVTVTDANLCSTMGSTTIVDSVTTYSHQNGIVINSNTTWLGVNFKVNEGIIIEPGNILSIANSIIQFSEKGALLPPGYIQTIEKGIVVEPGAKLLIENSILTGLNECSTMWDGIAVLSDIGDCVPQNPNPMADNHHGFVFIHDSSVVENAHIGIEVDCFIPNCAMVSVGGIIWVTSGTRFINNRKDVVLAGLTGCANALPDDISKFDKVQFLTTAPLVDTVTYHGEGTDVHLELRFVLGIPIRGCTFKNIGTFAQFERGTGIKSYDASYIVDRTCDVINNTTCECEGQRSRFERLFYGIDAASINPLRTLEVDGSEFVNNFQGIYLKGINNARILRNDFEVNLLFYSIYLMECHTYQIEENSFTSTNPGYIGLIIYNNVETSYTDRFYNNTFDTLLAASVLMGKNRGMGPAYQGLQVKCNDYTNNNFDIVVTVKPGISKLQGGDQFVSSPAGNTFDTCLVPEGEIRMNSGVGDMDYYHHTNEITTPDNGCYDSVLVTLFPTIFGFDKQTSCPTTDFTEPGCGGCNPPCWEERIAVNLQQADSVKGVLVSLIDGGDTQSLLSFIQLENSAGKIKDAILDVSPYTSDAVLITAINKNKNLPDGILKEILLANSPLSDDVLDALLNRVPPVAPGILKEILAAQTGISTRALLENQINFFLSEASLEQNNLISWFIHNDSLGGIDSIIPILENDTLIDSKTILVSAYLATGDTANAQLLIDSLALIPETQNFATLQQLFIDFGDTLFSVILNDSVVRHQVEQIAADTTKAGSIQARIIMELLFGIRIPEVIVLPTQNQLKTGGEDSEEDEQQVDIISKQTKPELFQTLTAYDGYTLTSYPNPYRESTIIAAFIPPHFDKSQLIIFNLLGKMLMQYDLKPGHNFIEIPSDELPYGINFYSLISGKIRIETQKLVHIE